MNTVADGRERGFEQGVSQVHGPHLHVVSDVPPDLTEVPDYLQPREYGQHLIMPVRLGDLIMLSQQRGDVNPEMRSIGESIEKSGLLNQIDVVRMDQETLGAYVDFTNRLWGSTNAIDNYTAAQDSSYYLVAAGHSRTLAIIDNEKARSQLAEEAGHTTNWGDATMWVKLHEADSPEDILMIQINENLHAKPSQERTAMGIVEMYMYGLEHGKWSNDAEFRRALGHKFTKKAVEDAVAFTKLPPEIRELVFGKSIKYGPAVALARAIGPYRELVLFESFGDKPVDELDEAKQKQFEYIVHKWVHAEASDIRKGNWNVTFARKRYTDFVQQWAAKIAKGRGDDAEVQVMALFTDDFYDPDAAFKAEQRRLRRRIKDNEVAIGKQTVAAALSLRIHTVDGLGADSDEAKEVHQTLLQVSEAVARGAGGTALDVLTMR